MRGVHALPEMGVGVRFRSMSCESPAARVGWPAVPIARGVAACVVCLSVFCGAGGAGGPATAADDDVVEEMPADDVAADEAEPDADAVDLVDLIEADDNEAAPAPAEDDAAKPLPPARGASRPDGEPAGPFVVALVNGDRLTGTITTLGPRGLQIRPDVAAGGVVELPLATVDCVDRSVPIEPLEARGDRLNPVTGGAISGDLVGMTAQGVTVDAHLVGRVQLPLTALAAFVREGEAPPERTAAPRFSEVHVKSGSLVVGHLAFEATGLGVSNAGMSAKIAFDQIRAILFPVDAPAVPAEDGTSCRIELCNGSEIFCAAPELDGTVLRVRIGGTAPVAVPLDHVSRLSFAGGGPAGGRRRVLVWSTHADGEEEVKNMLTALREGLPAGWTVDVDAALTGLDALARGLQATGVFIVPEMESFNPRRAPDPGRLGVVLREFLTAGGTVVICSIDGETQDFWENTGLVSLTGLDRVDEDGDDGTFEFVRGHWLGAKVGDSFQGTNGTYAYQTDDDALRPVAVNPEKTAAALVKKVGRGRLVLLGMDYFTRSEAIDRVLVNAVTGGR